MFQISRLFENTNLLFALISSCISANLFYYIRRGKCRTLSIVNNCPQTILCLYTYMGEWKFSLQQVLHSGAVPRVPVGLAVRSVPQNQKSEQI